MENTDESILKAVDDLVEAWCDRRCYTALRHILNGYPISSPLTDGWAALLDALENVRAFAQEEITEDEKLRVNMLIAEISKMVFR